MKDEAIAVKVGSGGRVVIPIPELRKRGIAEGDIVMLYIRKTRVEEVGGKE